MKMADKLKERVLKSIEAVRPALQADGGDVEIVEVDENAKTVKVRLQGACSVCMGAAATLEYGVMRAIQRGVPEIKEVIAV